MRFQSFSGLWLLFAHGLEWNFLVTNRGMIENQPRLPVGMWVAMGAEPCSAEHLWPQRNGAIFAAGWQGLLPAPCTSCDFGIPTYGDPIPICTSAAAWSALASPAAPDQGFHRVFGESGCKFDTPPIDRMSPSRYPHCSLPSAELRLWPHLNTSSNTPLSSQGAIACNSPFCCRRKVSSSPQKANIQRSSIPLGTLKGGGVLLNSCPTGAWKYQQAHTSGSGISMTFTLCPQDSHRPQPQGPSLLHRLHCPVEEWYPNMGNPWKSTTSILPIYSHIFQVKAQGPCTLGISQPCFMALSGHPTSHPTSSRSSRPSCFRSIATRASSSSLFRSRNCTFACNAHGIPLW